MVVCPKCRKPYTGRPALSRVDNKTDICPDCGMREAIESIPGMNDRKRMYLAGKKEEAEDNGFRFKVTESERHGVVVKIAEVDK